jgi:hypothetical protein
VTRHRLALLALDHPAALAALVLAVALPVAVRALRRR